MKQNKQIYIDWILEEMNKGHIQFGSVSKKFMAEFSVTEQTFVTWWKKANLIYAEQRKLINEAKQEQIIKTQKEAVTASSFKREEALKMLANTAKIFYNKIQVKKETANAKDAMVLCAVIDKIDKIEGWSTIKVEQHNTFSASNIENFKTFVLSKAEGLQEVDVN